MRRYRYDIAFSYAGEDRSFVEEVASILQARGVAVFYDRFESVDLWGKDLYTHFQSIFASKAHYVVVFISRAYIEKPWPKRELVAALSRPRAKGQPRIWPARFDDTPVPGLSEEVAYQDLRQHSPASFTDFVYQKLVLCGAVLTSGEPMIPSEPSLEEEPYVESLAKAILMSCGINPDFPRLPASWKYLPSDTTLARKVLELAHAYSSPAPHKVLSLMGSAEGLLETTYKVARGSQDRPDVIFYLPILTVLQGRLSTTCRPYLGFHDATMETDPDHMENVTTLRLHDWISVRNHPLSRAYRDPWMQDWEGAVRTIQLNPVPRSLGPVVRQMDRSQVEVLGTIWPSENQHHHTDVLLDTLDIRPADSAPRGGKPPSYSHPDASERRMKE